MAGFTVLVIVNIVPGFATGPVGVTFGVILWAFT